MSKSKRVQVLMEPRDFTLLESIARRSGSSVSDLMREAARERYLKDEEALRRSRSVKKFLSLPDVPLPEWKRVKKEIEQRRGKNFS